MTKVLKIGSKNILNITFKNTLIINDITNVLNVSLPMTITNYINSNAPKIGAISNASLIKNDINKTVKTMSASINNITKYIE